MACSTDDLFYPQSAPHVAEVDVITTVDYSKITKRSQPCEKLVGKRIVVICCGLDGLDSKRFTFVRAFELGIRVFLVEDGRNTLAQALEKDGLVEEYLRVDMSPRLTLLHDVLAVLASVQSRIGGFDGVCTFWDDSVSLTARVAEYFGLPGNSALAVDIAHDKHRTRACMRQAGLPTPRSQLLTSEADAREAARLVGVPAIIKPMYGASSLAVLKVENVDDVVPTYHRVRQLLREFYDEGELMGLTFETGSNKATASLLDAEDVVTRSKCSGLYQAGNVTDTEDDDNNAADEKNPLSYLVMEEYLDGEEVDVDLVLQNGKVLYSCVSDDWPQIEPWFAEYGNNCPSVLDDAKQKSLIDMAVRSAVDAMNFHTGVLHVELKLTSQGPRLIEVNPRMGGGPVWRLHQLAFGCDLIQEHFLTTCGIPSTLRCSPRSDPLRYVSCGEKFFERSMKIPLEFCRIVQEIRTFPNVIEATILVEVGQHVVGIADGFPTRCARFIVTADSARGAQDYAMKLLMMCDLAAAV